MTLLDDIRKEIAYAEALDNHFPLYRWWRIKEKKFGGARTVSKTCDIYIIADTHRLQAYFKTHNCKILIVEMTGDPINKIRKLAETIASIGDSIQPS